VAAADADAVAASAWFREFGPVFTWKLGPEKVVAIMDYEIIRTLLKLGESKVSGEGSQGIAVSCTG
jgi:hypothetical protein